MFIKDSEVNVKRVPKTAFYNGTAEVTSNRKTRSALWCYTLLTGSVLPLVHSTWFSLFSIKFGLCFVNLYP